MQYTYGRAIERRTQMFVCLFVCLLSFFFFQLLGTNPVMFLYLSKGQIQNPIMFFKPISFNNLLKKYIKIYEEFLGLIRFIPFFFNREGFLRFIHEVMDSHS